MLEAMCGMGVWPELREPVARGLAIEDDERKKEGKRERKRENQEEFASDSILVKNKFSLIH